MSIHQAHKADLLLLVVTLLAAISWMFSKEAVLAMPPLLFMSLRFLLAASLLAMAAHRQLRRLSGQQLLRCVRVGTVFGIAMSCWVMGLAMGEHVGEGAFLTSLGVVLVPVIGRLIFAEPVPGSTWLALPVAAAGLALLSLDQGLHLEAGQLFFVAAATIFALYFNLNTRAANTLSTQGMNGECIEHPRVPALALTTVVLAVVGVLTLAKCCGQRHTHTGPVGGTQCHGRHCPAFSGTNLCAKPVTAQPWCCHYGAGTHVDRTDGSRLVR